MNFISYEHKTKGLIYFEKSQIISVVMENNFVYGVYMHNLSICGRNASKRKRRSKKSCLLKKLLFSIVQKVLFKTQNDQS